MRDRERGGERSEREIERARERSRERERERERRVKERERKRGVRHKKGGQHKFFKEFTSEKVKDNPEVQDSTAGIWLISITSLVGWLVGWFLNVLVNY